MMAWRAWAIPVIMGGCKINKNLCDMRFSWEKVLTLREVTLKTCKVWHQDIRLLIMSREELIAVSL